MAFALKQTTPPSSEPVSLSDMKLHLRVDIDDDDSLIQALISAARERAEDFTGRCFVPQTWTFGLDRFPGYHHISAAPSRADHDRIGWDGMAQWNRSQTITIPRSPLIAVTGITYSDQGTGESITLDPSTYEIDNLSEPGRLKPVYGANWPVALSDMNSVLIQFTAGYTGTIPATIIAAIKLTCGALYNNRESFVVGQGNAVELPYAAEALLTPYRVLPFGYFGGG
jgi:uncharacterized phiE125 gp8 family phage protein